jgi:uncharacterized RDD family membrane protein YckC
MSATAGAPAVRAPATLRRRLAAMVYELLIVVAITFLVGLAFVLAYAAVTGESGPLRIRGPGRLLLQISVLAVLGAYFVWFWQLGRTLPMKTWDLQLTGSDGRPVSARAALVRFLVAAAVFVPALVGVLELRQDRSALPGWAALLPLLAAVGWVAIDRDRQPLWDRIAGTRLVHVPRKRTARAA